MVNIYSVDFPHTSGVGKITNNEGRRPELFGLIVFHKQYDHNKVS